MTEILKKASRVKKRYFIEDELWETIDKHSKFKDAKSYTKEYLYQSGAKYNGEWEGGFRHGKGVMQWPDGAKYEGQWVLGHA